MKYFALAALLGAITFAETKAFSIVGKSKF